MISIFVLNGPNLNLLGTREPEHYGAKTLDEIIDALRNKSAYSEVDLVHFQSNAEHELVEKVQQAPS